MADKGRSDLSRNNYSLNITETINALDSTQYILFMNIYNIFNWKW